MKTNKKNISGAVALALFWVMNLVLAKGAIDKEAVKNEDSPNSSAKTLANIDCNEIQQQNIAVDSQWKNDHLFMGCNWFY